MLAADLLSARISRYPSYGLVPCFLSTYRCASFDNFENAFGMCAPAFAAALEQPNIHVYYLWARDINR